MSQEELDDFVAQRVVDNVRQLRNQSEYDALLLEADDVADALARADAIIRVVGKDLDA